MSPHIPAAFEHRFDVRVTADSHKTVVSQTPLPAIALALVLLGLFAFGALMLRVV